ncbi:amine oxidase [Talaromyces proteolyticus]|uniref:Amine oxidase n=1 Tax=Talaromyces proteolyticus TaxID=1131652 RepID=A0AAD4KTG9_9EURO|nr:amine oxidase [Talaromyces proteolyticus]KAH8698948.1 amine oxidase [Talaromyces proteolyticus]
METTADGYSWTEAHGTKKGGFKCRGVVFPPERRSSNSTVYDTIVIGAGYAGLAAARDLATSKRSVLLLEARDRVGGRTYTLEDEDGSGFLFEMGGTWVTHHFAYVLKEMTRYNMHQDMIVSQHPGYENDYYTLNIDGVKPRKLSHEEAGQMLRHAWDTFVNVDGDMCRKICPLPHIQLGNSRVDRKEVEKIDKKTCKERLDEIRNLLSTEEVGMLSSLLLIISGGTLEKFSLWDIIRSQALLIHSSLNFADIWSTYKLREGQSALARRMFDEAADFGLEYMFNTQVTSIMDQTRDIGGYVKVTTSNNEVYTARRVICTIPLNVLKTIQFSPPLSAKRQEAINIGHINFMSKIHAVADGPGLASWHGSRFPGKLATGQGDGLTAQGDAHLVAFGGDERKNFTPELEPEKVVAAWNELHPMRIKKTVFHNWCTDPYSNGGPAWWPAEYMSKYQDELQSPFGAISFASGDWAHGWRASIDGALEQGSLCSIRVLRELNNSTKSHNRQTKL